MRSELSGFRIDTVLRLNFGVDVWYVYSGTSVGRNRIKRGRDFLFALIRKEENKHECHTKLL